MGPLFLGALLGGLSSVVGGAISGVASTVGQVAAPLLQGVGQVETALKPLGGISGVGGLIGTVQNLINKPDSPRRTQRRAEAKLQAQQQVLQARGQIRAPGSATVRGPFGDLRVGDRLPADVVDFEGNIIPAGTIIPLGRSLGEVPAQGLGPVRRSVPVPAAGIPGGGENTFSRFSNGGVQVGPNGEVYYNPTRLAPMAFPVVPAQAQSRVLSGTVNSSNTTRARQGLLSNYSFDLGVSPSLRTFVPSANVNQATGFQGVSFNDRGPAPYPAVCTESLVTPPRQQLIQPAGLTRAALLSQFTGCAQ